MSKLIAVEMYGKLVPSIQDEYQFVSGVGLPLY